MFLSLYRIAILAIALLGLAATPTQANNVSLAVASNFIAPIKELKKVFESKSNYLVRLSSASSGKLYAQIVQGAPFDIFLSADSDKPRRLIKTNRAIKNSLFTYAQGTLALWSSNSELIKNEAEIFELGSFNKLALANPRLAPYGAAAQSVLQHLNLIQATRAKWVQGENISQTYQFVRSGNAQLGFVALSQIQHQGKFIEGSYWLPSANWYPEIRQDAVLLNKGKTNLAALTFLTFLKSDQAKSIIRQHGYTTPD
jgi:molybdate transport system substrate-binding protein